MYYKSAPLNDVLQECFVYCNLKSAACITRVLNVSAECSMY